MTSLRCLIVIIALVLPTAPAAAHPLAPSFVHIVLGDGAHEVTVRASRVGRRPILRTPCVVSALGRHVEGELEVAAERWVCPPGATLKLVTEPGAPAVIVERTRAGESAMVVLDHAHPSLVIDDALGPSWSRWLALGVEHLVGGLDHVLVVIALVALMGLRFQRRGLVLALSAFTLGHSLSLALAATGVVTLPSAVVEIAIALTLVGLGLELAAPGPGPGLVARRPWIGGLTIGLVHGLGFAGVLAELLGGSDATRLAPALVGFNVGLELGQLALVAVLFIVARALTRVSGAELLAHAPRLAGWLVGVAGAAWVFDRAWP